MKRNKRRLIILTILAAASLLSLLSAVCIVIYEPYDGMTAVFIDVGQGDAALITAQGKSVLIDAGGDRSAEAVKTELERYGVEKPDVLICSHTDSDHIGGAAEIIESCGADTVYIPKFGVEKTDEYLDMISALDELGIFPLRAGAGESIELGNLRLEFLSPSGDSGDANDNSLVVKLTYEKTSLLFTGDISEKVEKELQNVRADVLKVSHHGSAKSSGGEFLDRVKPKIAVISLSRYNSYNFPSIMVTERLENLGCEIYRTSENGSVVIRSDGDSVTALPEK